MNDNDIELKPSEIISAFLKLIDTSTKNYNVAQEYVDEYDREEADLVHKCELQGKGMKQNEKSKNYTMLCNNRNARRYWKDIVDMYKPINEFLESCPESKKVTEKLKQVLGKVRKAEDYLANRTYKPKAKINQ